MPVGLLLAAVALVASLAPAAQASTHPKVKVMTQNLYLGADLVPLLTAPDTGALLERAGDTWRAVQETNFPARAKALATLIAKKKPQLIGLQEVALFRREAGPPDFDEAGGAPPDATEVVYDFLDSLRHQLDLAGVPYKVASKQQEADLELPLDFTHDSTINPSYDGRLTMRDVILAKKGLDTKNPQSGQYSQELPVDLPPAGPSSNDTSVPRGWTSIDVKKGGEKFRFVNTHLEAYSNQVRTLQAKELASISGPLDTGKPRILVGDLNSDPNIPPINDQVPSNTAYEVFTSTGAPPAGSIHSFQDRGVGDNTCCHDPDLLDPDTSSFNVHIDHVLVKPNMNLAASPALVGTNPADRTPFGLWPSDHAGVISTLFLP